MKYTELRIGNIFKEKYSGDLVVVSELTKDRITFDYQTNEKWQSEPIELTEEILLKYGFEYDDAFYYKDGIFLEYDDNSLRVDCMSDSVSVKYLHQLQNLYFALRNKELEINF